MIDLDGALAWAGAALGSPVATHERMVGGLTSRMLALRHADGSESVLRLMTNEPWRTHGAALTTREHAAQVFLAGTDVPAPTSIALDADGAACGVAAHLMTRLPGRTIDPAGDDALRAMADLLATIHAQRPAEPFRTFESWAWEEKWVVPSWTQHPASWRRAFEILARPAPAHEPTFLHRDAGHRNLLWVDGAVSGVVDWVETSTGPAWLDAVRAASSLAVLVDEERAKAFLDAYDVVATERFHPYWMVMDAVGYLPPPGRPPLFRRPEELQRLDRWLDLAIELS